MLRFSRGAMCPVSEWIAHSASYDAKDFIPDHAMAPIIGSTYSTRSFDPIMGSKLVGVNRRSSTARYFSNKARNTLEIKTLQKSDSVLGLYPRSRSRHSLCHVRD